jgi:hypothetical protein
MDHYNCFLPPIFNTKPPTMKKLIFLFFAFITLAGHSQKSVISTVNTVKPKAGQRMAFEAAYKLHIAKFHKTDEKMSVYEIMTGTHSGCYLLVNGGRSFEDFDKDRADANAHYLDLDKNFYPYLETAVNGNYRFVDSLSFRPQMQAEAFTVFVRHIKPTMLADYRVQMARGVKVITNLKSGMWDSYSVGVFDLLWAGSDPTIVTVRNLKDGFKSLETDFYGPMAAVNSSFRDEYVKQFGTLEWDKRQKFLDEAVISSEQYIMKLRKDLSSN